MKSGNVFWGVLLVVLGGLFLLENLGVVCFSLGELWRFWPLLLVFWGVSALVKDKRARWVVAALVAILLALVLFSLFSFRWSGCWSDDDFTNVETQVLSEPYDSGITHASLEISAGAAKVVVDGTTTEHLLQAETKSSIGECALSSVGSGDTRTLTLDIPRRGNRVHFGNIRNEALIRMNTSPEWEVSLGVGATSADLNLQPFNVKRVEVEAGATSVKIRLGMPKEETEVRIEAGASSVTIEVPREAACAVSIDAPLSSQDLDDFRKVHSGRYETENYGEGQPSIWIKINAGVSKVRINRN
jgi:hypothetical protein